MTPFPPQITPENTRESHAFEDLRVWQKSRELARAIYRATATGKFARNIGLRDQIQRAAVSIMSNIAEGVGRHSRPEMRQFLAIARASSFEVRSQLYLALDLGYLSEAEHNELHALCDEVGRLIAALRASLTGTKTDPEQPHLAPGTWHLAPGTWHLAPGTWHLAPGT